MPTYELTDVRGYVARESEAAHAALAAEVVQLRSELAELRRLVAITLEHGNSLVSEPLEGAE